QGWGENLMSEVFSAGKETDFDIVKPVKVYVLYYTVWIGDKGQIVYGSDVYNYDSKLIDALAGIDGYHLPVHYVGGSGRIATRSEIAYSR
ncbi:MAG TPA: hypothetical protein DEA55_00915, partial [Rhodospirillaceae bacterium]|nr:hypothetical protein [Rhodospirillaceae bacterium]